MTEQPQWASPSSLLWTGTSEYSWSSLECCSPSVLQWQSWLSLRRGTCSLCWTVSGRAAPWVSGRNRDRQPLTIATRVNIQVGSWGGELGQGSQGGGEDLELSGALYIISVTWNDPSSSRMLDTFYIDSLSCYTHYTVFQYLRICFNNGIALTYNYYILLKISQRNSSTHPTNSGNQGTGSNPSIPEVGWHQLWAPHPQHGEGGRGAEAADHVEDDNWELSWIPSSE